MKKTESIEKDALTEMMSPSVSPSAARDAEVKKSVELALQDYTPKNGIADTVIDGSSRATIRYGCFNHYRGAANHPTQSK